MSVARIVPHRQASDASFRRERWTADLGADEKVLGESLADWDPATPVRFQRTLQVDLLKVCQECGLPEGTRVILGASWRCTGTTLRGAGTRVAAEARSSIREVLQIEVPGNLLAADLHLVVSLVLGETLPPAPLRARRVGTVLWESEQTVQLEGGGARFPMEVRSFRGASWRFPERAAWLLDLSSDWEQPVLAGMRLYLNEDHPQVTAALAAPDQVAARVFFDAMFWDVGRQLVRGALQSPDFCAEGRTWPKDSLGQVVARLLRSRFPRKGFESLAAEMQRDPAGFDATLQDALRAWEPRT